MVRVKVCGLKRVEDALLAVELGAEMLGLNFWKGSARKIELSEAREIASVIKGKAKIVGVFVNQSLEDVLEIAQAIPLDMVQLHGEETPGYCNQLSIPVIKALRLGEESDLRNLDLYPKVLWLIDSKTERYGGSGISPDWALARKANEKAGKIILAGGLNPENVAQAIQIVQPWAVDVASGIEISPGVKDKNKMRKFFEELKNVAG